MATRHCSRRWKSKQVDEKLPAVHFQPELAADEGEEATHGAQELFDAAHQRALQLAFGMLLAEFEKVEGILILDGQLCLGAQLGRQGLVEIGLAEQGLLIALVLDLVDQHVLGPAELLRHADVELAFKRIFASFQNDKVMAPSDFSHQWCEFFG